VENGNGERDPHSLGISAEGHRRAASVVGLYEAYGVSREKTKAGKREGLRGVREVKVWGNGGKRGWKRPVAHQQAGQCAGLTVGCTPNHHSLSCLTELHF